MIEFIVPGLPPSLWKAYVRTPRGQFLSLEGKRYKAAVFTSVQKVKSGLSYKFEHYKDTYSMVIEFHSKTWRNKDGSVKKKDVTNLIKIAEDAISEALKIDDCHFFEVRVKKVESDDEYTRFTLE